MQDKHRPCQDGMFFRHSVQKERSHPEPFAEMDERARERMQLHCTLSRQTKMCDHEFICLQEISKLSRSVLNCLARQKTKDSRGNIIKTCSDVSHIRGQRVVFHDDRRASERARSYSSIH